MTVHRYCYFTGHRMPATSAQNVCPLLGTKTCTRFYLSNDMFASKLMKCKEDTCICKKKLLTLP